MSKPTVTTARERQYWRLLSNPSKYRILDAVRNLDTDLWEVDKNTDIRPGDRVLIWMAKGNQSLCGAVALGEVVEEKEWLTDADNPYWIEPRDGCGYAWRVRVRYVKSKTLPRWLGTPEGEALTALRVGKAPRPRRMNLSRSEWDPVLAAIGVWPAYRRCFAQLGAVS